MHSSSGIAIRILFVVCLCLLAGCGGGSGSSQTGNSTSGGTVLQSTLARDTNPLVSDAELASVVSGNTEFALKLFPLLDQTPGNNTFFSPYSITQAFALLAPGARGTTLGEIEQVLFFTQPLTRRNPAFNKLDLLLASRTTGAVLASGLQSPRLNNANALWVQPGFSVIPAYLDTLSVNFGAGLHEVDFIKDTENSRQTINRWVEGQTNNRIVDLIPIGGVSSSTRMVLANAIWFKANWASQFQKGATASQPFINRDNSTASIPFMHQTLSAPYARTSGCQAVDIPYAGDALSMLVIMPDAGTFDAFAGSLTPALLNEITGKLTPGMVNLGMPKFTYSRSASLNSILKSLGMNDTFAPGTADLSGIDGGRDLFVGSVFHQAFIGVDEAGTEAAAATAITIGVTSIPVVNQTLTIDHPFIFLIRDRQTGLILFMGRVVSL